MVDVDDIIISFLCYFSHFHNSSIRERESSISTQLTSSSKKTYSFICMFNFNFKRIVFLPFLLLKETEKHFEIWIQLFRVVNMTYSNVEYECHLSNIHHGMASCYRSLSSLSLYLFLIEWYSSSGLLYSSFCEAIKMLWTVTLANNETPNVQRNKSLA